MRIFRITFHNQGKTYRLHAEEVVQSDLYGFVEIRNLLFDEHTTVVIDPTEERIKEEFAHTTRLMIPMHTVIRIEEVEKRGQNLIFEGEEPSNVTPFPGPGPKRS